MCLQVVWSRFTSCFLLADIQQSPTLGLCWERPVRSCWPISGKALRKGFAGRGLSLQMSCRGWQSPQNHSQGFWRLCNRELRWQSPQKPFSGFLRALQQRNDKLTKSTKALLRVFEGFATEKWQVDKVHKSPSQGFWGLCNREMTSWQSPQKPFSVFLRAVPCWFDALSRHWCWGLMSWCAALGSSLPFQIIWLLVQAWRCWQTICFREIGFNSTLQFQFEKSSLLRFYFPARQAMEKTFFKKPSSGHSGGPQKPPQKPHSGDHKMKTKGRWTFKVWKNQ